MRRSDPLRTSRASGLVPNTATLWCPLRFEVTTIPRFLNAELQDHPVYDGIELQWFDDEVRGTGMLAFLSRRSDRRVDYYVQDGLTLAPADYQLGGGTGAWTATRFDEAHLDIEGDGVVASVRFTDVDGRVVEVVADDRAAGPSLGGLVLAPVGSAVHEPASLFLVLMHGFELVRQVGRAPRVRIDGSDVAVGRLPAARLHRRHLVKYAGPLTVGTVCHEQDGPLAPVDVSASSPVLGGARVEPSLDGQAVAALAAQTPDGTGRGRLDLDPPLPSLDALAPGRSEGAWWVSLDGAVITGGRWWAEREGDEVRLGLDVTRRWKPSATLPLLMRVVTRVLPVFRRWPTTYRWRATVTLGVTPSIRSRWERTARGDHRSYERATRR